jgi:ABC-type proline/glycine betaine transport system ATPase subunit
MLPLADKIMLMQDGKIIAIGSYNEIISRDPHIAVKVQKVERSVPLEPIIEVSKCYPGPVEMKQESKIEVQIGDNESTTGIKQQEPGPGSVYKYYIRSAGSGLVVAFLAFTLIEAFCNSFQS